MVKNGKMIRSLKRPNPKLYLVDERDAAAYLRVEYPECLVPLDECVELAVARVHPAEGVAVVAAPEAAALCPPRLRRQVGVDLPRVAAPPLDLKVPKVCTQYRVVQKKRPVFESSRL